MSERPADDPRQAPGLIADSIAAYRLALAKDPELRESTGEVERKLLARIQGLRKNPFQLDHGGLL